jgi:hypothetical protein
MKVTHSGIALVLPLLLAISLCTCDRALKSDKAIAKSSKSASKSLPIKEIVMDDLRRPWSMKFLSEDEALLNEKDGNLLRVNLATGTKSIITGLPADLADSLLVDTFRLPRN